jgi:hypothetical protein
MEHKSSLPKKSTTEVNREPTESNPPPHTAFLYDSFKLYILPYSLNMSHPISWKCKTIEFNEYG